ncbi:MFS transporter [Simkania sp.]|uniref:MFS transporter n=1 Tax=Simkania sp. TaxID=34094 RepID=UPI003B516200
MEKGSAPSLLTLALLLSLAAVGALFYTPALPQLTRFFHVSPNMVQLTVMTYLIGYAVSQLCYGPLSKQYGRKRAIYIGLALAFLGSLGCGLSSLFHSFWLLVIARFIMAFGAAVGYALTFTILNDYYSVEERRKLIPIVAIGMMLLPYGSVVLGGFIVEYLGWDIVFYVFCLYTVYVFLLARRLPETANNSNQPYRLKETLKDYVAVLKFPQLTLFSLIIGCCVAVFYIFSSVAPFLAIHVMSLTEGKFGLMNVIPILGFLFGTFIARRLAAKFSGISVVTLALILMFCFEGVMLLLFIFGLQNVWVLFITAFFIMAALQLVWANGTALATRNIPDAAHASSMMSFYNVGLGVIGVLVMSGFNLVSPAVLPLIFIGVTLVQLLALIIIRVKKIHE